MKYKSFVQYLMTEMPLPKDMDPEALTPKRGKFDPQVDRQTGELGKHGEKVGEGSSRAAYRVKVETSQFHNNPERWGAKGGYVDTVIKVAINSKGVAQNDQEIQVYKKFKKNPLLLPIIDDSSKHRVRVILKGKKANNTSSASWVQMPYATQLEDHAEFGTKFKQFFGDLGPALKEMEPQKYKFNYYTHLYMRHGNLDGLRKLTPSKYIRPEQFHNLTNVLHLIDSGIKMNDLSRPENWGFWNDNIYILDYGFTDTTLGLYTGREDAIAETDSEGNIILKFKKTNTSAYDEDGTDEYEES